MLAAGCLSVAGAGVVVDRTSDEGPAEAITARTGPSPIARLPVQLVADNGGWCWWQSPRAVVTADGDLLAATTPSSAGAGGGSRATDVSALDIASGRSTTATLMEDRLSADDHTSGAVLELPSGRVVTAWAGHSEEPYVHVAWRGPGADDWTLGEPVHRPESDANIPTQGFGSRANVTYSNLVWVGDGDEGRLYDFFRGRADQPAAMVSDDEGETWTYLGEVLSRPGGRPYVRYVATGDRIWFTASLGHPEEARGSPLYAGYIEDDAVHRTDGTRLGALGDGVDPERLTEVFRDTSERPVPWAPDPYGVLTDSDAWGADLAVASDGAIVTTFTVRRPERSPIPGREFVHDLYWARLDPARGSWEAQRIGDAGSELMDGQPSYTGLAAIDPTARARVYLSTDVDPVDRGPLVSAATGRPQHELWEGTSADGGRSWAWAPVTADSAEDNLRPTVAADHGSWALVWLRGTYTDFRDDYDQAVVAVTRSTDSSPG